jgi:hypothetical protein
MPFWTSALSEPRRSHRFLLTLPNLASANGAFTYQQYLAKSATKPSYQVGATEHKFLGNTYYYPGVVTWQPVSVVLVNAVNPDGNQILYDALVNSGYLKPDVQQDVFLSPSQAPSTVNKAAAVRVVGDVIIEELNGEGGLVGTWTLNNSFITDAKFGDLNYDNDTLLNIDITFRYDWAEYVSGAAVAAATDL